jgi:hypothetical protein
MCHSVHLGAKQQPLAPLPPPSHASRCCQMLGVVSGTGQTQILIEFNKPLLSNGHPETSAGAQLRWFYGLSARSCFGAELQEDREHFQEQTLRKGLNHREVSWGGRARATAWWLGQQDLLVLVSRNEFQLRHVYGWWHRAWAKSSYPALRVTGPPKGFQLLRIFPLKSPNQLQQPLLSECHFPWFQLLWSTSVQKHYMENSRKDQGVGLKFQAICDSVMKPPVSHQGCKLSFVQRVHTVYGFHR